MRIRTSRTISILALFVAFAVILSYVETLIPSVGIPGVKIGLANLAVVLAMYLLGYWQAALINVLRIIIIGFFFGSLFSVCFSVAGAFLSFIAMALLKRVNKCSIIVVSIVGSVCHNIAQILLAGIVVSTYSVWVYLPVLLVSGIVMGLVIGVLSRIMYKRLGKFFLKY